jgi:hypothetical protein
VEAATLLNQAQNVFTFEVKEGPPIKLTEGESFHKWASIDAMLSRSEVRTEANFLFGILEEPIENNWFSRAVWGRGVGYITTHSWELVSDLPVESFLAYELVENLTELLWIADEAEGQRFLTEVVHLGVGRGCLYDMCDFKPRIGIKIRSGDICPECLSLLESRLDDRELMAVLEMLEGIRLLATGRKLGSERRPRGLLAAAGDFSPEEPKRNLQVISQLRAKRVSAAPAQEMSDVVQHLCHCAPNLRPEDAVGHLRVCGSTPREVDQHYPFPVAHCFRAMRVEVSGTRKFKMLLQLYAVITKYITLALLASRTQATTTQDTETRDLLRRLRRGTHGTWGESCFRLLRERMADPNPGFMDYLTRNISIRDVDACERISKEFVKLRNDTEGHGFMESEDTYERLFLKQLEPAHRLLTLMQPLANYSLFRLVQVKSNREGNCICDARMLHGSNPLFEVEQLVSSTVPESDCLLRHPLRDEHLNLWPWLLLDDCPECKRQMVFLYDTLEQNGAVFREYPNNHCKRNGEVGVKISNCIG